MDGLLFIGCFLLYLITWHMELLECHKYHVSLVACYFFAKLVKLLQALLFLCVPYVAHR